MAILTRCSFFLYLIMAGLAFPARAQELQLHEQEIKAALLYNFLKYTDWPDGALSASSVTLCVFGDDPFGGYLKPMAGRSVNQHVITIHQSHDMAAMQHCNLLFVNAGERSRWPALHAALKGAAILTISDFDSFDEQGGMIEFGHRDSHINATLNMDAVRAAGLSVEDRLLRLVTVVHSGTGGQP